MPKTFDTWTVLPHKPIEKLADNLWRVSGTMGQVQRQMVLARRPDGGLLVHNAIALGEAEMAEVEAWGTPAFLFVPNGYHRQDAAIWKQRYPKITVVAPAASKKRVDKVVKVETTTEELAAADPVALMPIDGMPAESVLKVQSGEDVTLVFCDAIFNVPKRRGAIGFMLSPTGQTATPRIVRWWFLKDKRAFTAQLERLAATPGLRRVLVGHGRPINEDPASALRAVVAQLS